MIYHSNSPKETRKIAANLAVKLHKLQVGLVIALEGELGAGKTTFAQAFIRALGVKTKVKSPTFNIIKKYRIPSGSSLYLPVAICYVYHIDCYRLKDHNEAMPLGVKEIFKEKGSIILAEWPERIKRILPRQLIRVHIDHIDKNKRKIKISNYSNF